MELVSKWVAGPVSSAVKAIAEGFAQNMRLRGRFRRSKRRAFDPFLDDKRTLIQAAADGDLETLREITAKRPQCVDCKLAKEDLAPGQEPFEGITPLMVAMQMQNADCVAFLAPLSDVGLRDDTGPWKMAQTGPNALMRAAWQSFEMFNLLWPFASLEAINAHGGVGVSVLMEAIIGKNYGAMRLLLADGRHNLNLQCGDWTAADPEAKTVSLEFAVSGGDEEALKIMLPWHSEKEKIEAFEKCLRECVKLDDAPVVPGGFGGAWQAWPCVDLLAFHVPAEIANRGLAAVGPGSEKKMPLWAGRVAAEKEARELRDEIAAEKLAPIGAPETSALPRAKQRGGSRL